MDNQPFDAGMVLTILDDLIAHFGPSRLPSIEPAWDATWTVCVSKDPRHETAARTAFASVVIDLHRLGAAPTLARAGGSTAPISP